MSSILIVAIIILGIVILGALIGVGVFVLCPSKNDIYTFVFNDGRIPGATYTGSVDFKSGATIVKIAHGCSLLPEECAKLDLNESYSGTLNAEQLEKVKKVLEKNDNKMSSTLAIAMANILQGSKICIEEEKLSCLDSGIETLDYLLSTNS